MAILKKLTITSRIAAGFIGMIVILMIAGGIAYIQAAGMERSVHQLEDMAGDALLASELNADMAKVLLYTREYMSDRTKESLETTRKYLGETKEGIEKARAEMHKPSRVALVQKMDADIKTFETGLMQIVALYAKRDAMVTNQLDRIGPVVRKGLTEINESATREAAYETANLAGRAQEDFLLARLYVNKYLLSNANEDADRAQSSINDALAEMERLGASINSPQRKKAFDTIAPSIREYRDAVGQVGALIAERNKLRDETVVKTGRAISQWASEIKASAVADQHALASDVVAEAKTAEWEMILLNVAGFVMAALLAFFIARSISRPVNTLTSAMSQLATGDLSVEVPATERHDEIGKMAKALMVFKEALIVNKEAEAAAAAEADAKMRRAQVLDEMTKRFEANVSALTHGLASAATEMKATACPKG
jgi:HAMP domain-containing protein